MSVESAPMQPYYITTPIYYVNDRPHIGHCYTTLVADVAARMQRLIGRDVFFLTGTDEHAEKVSQSAADHDLDPIQWADINAAAFRRAFEAMNFSNDDFVRTTEDRHISKAVEYIQRLMDSGDIELGDYEGWYDPSQEEYLTETVAKDADYKSPVTGKPLEKRVEQNYFFRLDKYEGWLKGEIESDQIRILPNARKNEVLARFREGLKKVPVSRRIKEGDADWGIKMPGDADHRIYVWIEALCNYLTVIDTDDRRKYWPASVHLMAKDILWFHAVVWPAMLHALGEQAPKCVYAHAYFVAEGVKMSKSLGNFIEIDLLQAYSDRYSRDAVRWYLAMQGPLGSTDSDFAYKRFVDVYNADLANGIGNAVSRVGNMIGKYFDGVVPEAASGDGALRAVLGEGYDWQQITQTALTTNHAAADSFDLVEALNQGTDLVRKVDGFINVTEPFRLAKKLDEDPANTDTLAAILGQCAEALRIASLFLYPALPEKMSEIWRNWNCSPLVDPDDCNSGFKAPLAELAKWGGDWSLKPGQEVAKGEILFMRADPKEGSPAASSAS